MLPSLNLGPEEEKFFFYIQLESERQLNVHAFVNCL